MRTIAPAQMTRSLADGAVTVAAVLGLPARVAAMTTRLLASRTWRTRTTRLAKITRPLALSAMTAAAVLALTAPVAAAAPCKRTPSARAPQTDGARDAKANDALFRRVAVPGFTDVRRDTAGTAVQDFNGDGRTDLFVIYNNGAMRMMLGRGCMRFEDHRFRIVGSPYTYDNPPGGAAIANFADLNDDGHLDAFITHNTDGSNVTQRSGTPSAGNSLLLTQGRFDTFKEEASRLGVTNETAYNRQSSIADVDGDGHLDIGVGADQIGTPTFGGGSIQRLYVWRPEQGRYEDIGGTPRVPDFGGPLRCDPNIDRASPGILLRDLDGDNRPDLVQGYHNDMLLARPDPSVCPTGERRYGLTAWRNASAAGDAPRFDAVPRATAGLGGEGRMRWNPEKGDYDVITRGLGLPYVFAADAFNTGRLDLIAVGPTDPEFHINSDMIAGKFFTNRGDMRFADETNRRGLQALNWTAERWSRFYDAPAHHPAPITRAACLVAVRRPTCSALAGEDHQIYPSTVAWGDFDNDGCLDFVLADRHEDPTNVDGLRNTLFKNRCNGTFAPQTTQLSGLSTNSVSLEVADLDGDGLLDLVAGAQPTNSYPLADPPLPRDRYLDKVFLNTGRQGAAENHWVEIDLAGAPQRELIGAQLVLTAGKRTLGRRDYVTNDSYKSGRQPTVHWGLGKATRATVSVRLPGVRKARRIALPCVDRRLVVDVRRARVGGCD